MRVKDIFVFLLGFFLVLLYSIYEGWYSFLVFWLILWGISFFIQKKCFQNDYKNTFKLFNVFYVFYTVYMCITNYIYVDNPSTEFFMIVDSMKFWDNVDYPLNSYGDVWNQYLKDYAYTIRYTLFNFIGLNISYFSQLIDTNNILVHKLQNVFTGAFSISILYMILKKVVTNINIYKLCLFFGFFSFVSIYSIILNRDPYVYFFYLLGIYLIVYGKDISFGFVKLLVLMLLVMGIRLEHGLFFSFFIIIYIYINFTHRTSRFFFLSLVSIVSLLLMPFIYNKLNDNADAYETKRDNVERSSVSSGAALGKLPVGIRHVLLATNGQIAPAIPFWRSWYQEENNFGRIKYTQPGYFTPWRFMESIAATVWLYVLGFIVYGLAIKKIVLPKYLKYLFLVSIALLLLSSSSIDVRRVYCVYPIIFLVMAYCFQFFKRYERIKVIRFVSLGILSLYVFYFSFIW